MKGYKSSMDQNGTDGQMNGDYSYNGRRNGNGQRVSGMEAMRKQLRRKKRQLGNIVGEMPRR